MELRQLVNDNEWFKLDSISQTKLMIEMYEDRLRDLTSKNRDAIRQDRLKERLYQIELNPKRK